MPVLPFHNVGSFSVWMLAELLNLHIGTLLGPTLAALVPALGVGPGRESWSCPVSFQPYNSVRHIKISIRRRQATRATSFRVKGAVQEPWATMALNSPFCCGGVIWIQL